MKLFAIALSICMMALQSQAHAASYTDRTIFEEDAKQDIVKEQASRHNLQFRGLIVTKFDDSLNLCGEINQSDEPEWTRFIKIFDRELGRFNSVWIESVDVRSEVEEFKQAQFEAYWDRRCSSLYSMH